MDNNFEKVKEFLLDLEYTIIAEDPDEELFIVENEDSGIKNLVIDCEDPLLIFEQHIFQLKNDDAKIMKSLLMKNREIIHGAFVLDDEGKNVIFRDTLQLENLDMNELQGTLNSLELLLSEFANEIIEFSK